MKPETIAQLALEIRNLAHRGWEDRPNAEFLFREIGQRAQKISSLGGAAQEEAPSSHDWIHEDELPADYPYHAMFPYSIIPGGVGCRVFPRLPECVKVEEEAVAPPVVEYRSFCKICHRAIRLWSGTRETGDWVHAEQNVSSDHWAVPFEDRESKK